jgi:hypothetical protein
MSGAGDPVSVMKRFHICCGTLLLAAVIGLGPVCAKDSVPTVPALPSSYAAGQALADLPKADEAVVRERLRAWSLHHSFGGARPDRTALEQPRAAQAFWLALTTHTVLADASQKPAALNELHHLQRQKALNAATVEFFSALWEEKSSRPERAADFLRGWLQEHALPPLSPAESTAITAAVHAGCGALACFEKKSSVAQSKTAP